MLPHSLEGNETSTPCSPTLQHIHNIIVEQGCVLHCSASRGQHASLKLHPSSIQTTRRADGHKEYIVLINSPAHCAQHRERRISIQNSSNNSSARFKKTSRASSPLRICTYAGIIIVYIVACDYFCNYHTHLL